MSTRLLADIAWAHSGDKGDSVNLGVAVRDEKDYPVLLREVTAERVLKHFQDICRGEVRRYELPNLYAVNFVLTRILDGGPMRSLRLDPQGKTLGDSLLLMPLHETPVPAVESLHVNRTISRAQTP
jgi:hypothetical protein